MTSSVVLWDVGGVLVDFDPQDGRRRWRERLGWTESEFDEALWAAIGSFGAAQTGEIVARLAARFDVRVDDAERLLWASNDHWHPNTELIEYARGLRARGVRAAVVANAGAAARWAFEAIVDVGSFADAVIISAEVGVEKPDPAIWRLAMAELGAGPEDCVFVDDVAGHVEAARALGIHAFVHESTASTIAQLESAMAAG